MLKEKKKKNDCALVKHLKIKLAPSLVGLSLLVGGLITFLGCDLLELKKKELISFNLPLILNTVPNDKPIALASLHPDSIIVGGKNGAGLASLFLLSGRGEFKKNNALSISGQTIAIQQSFDPKYRIHALINKGRNFAIASLNKKLESVQLDSFAKKINQKIGLLDYVRANDFLVLNDGHFLVAGTVKQKIGNERAFLCKIGPDFNLVWIRTSIETAVPFTVSINAQGEIITSGLINRQTFVMKFSADGGEKWRRILTLTNTSTWNKHVIHEDKIYTFQNSWNNQSRRFESYLYVLDIEGKYQWDRYFFENPASSAFTISANREKTLWLLHNVSDGANSLIKLLCVNPQNGNLLWEREYEVKSTHRPTQIVQAKDFGILILATPAPFSQDATITLIKTDEEGIIEF